MLTRPQEIWEYHESTLAAFDLLKQLLRQPDLASAVPTGSPFYKVTLPELDRRVADMSVELGLEVSLALVASFEAILRDDFERRAGDSSASGVLDVRMKSAWKKRTDGRPSFEEILDAWKDTHPGSGPGIGEFKKVLNFRHFLAHGRSRQPKSHAQIDARTVVRAAIRLQTSVAGFPVLVDWNSREHAKVT
jgi:hypothetical protein